MNNNNKQWTGVALIAALIPSTIEMDMMVPSLPGMAAFFQVSASEAQAVLSRYYQGLILGLVVWGFVTERWGYKRTLLLGLCGITVANLGCYGSATWLTLLGWRLVQGLFAAAPMVASLAYATRVFAGTEERQFYGMMNASISFCLAISPLIGAYVYQMTDWRAIYLLMALITFVVAVVSAYILDTCESQPWSLSLYWQAVQRHATPSFILPSVFLSGMGAVYLLFMTTSTFIFQIYFNLPTLTYIGYYAVIIGSFTLMSCLAEPLRRWFGRDHGFNQACMAVSLICSFGLWWVQDEPLYLTGLMCVFVAMCACLLPWFYAMMMQCQPQYLGVSSALHNLIRFSVAAGLIGCQSWLFQGEPGTVIACMIVTQVVSIGLGLGYLKKVRQSDSRRLELAS
jgi:DHA1 family bicyclomycin/chloramphenicol resistance-like MFS transporter